MTVVVTLKEVLDSLPPERRTEIDRRYEELLNAFLVRGDICNGSKKHESNQYSTTHGRGR